MDHEYPNFSIKYNENEWIVPELGKLFVFSDRLSAERYYQSDSGLELWEVEVEDLQPLNYCLLLSASKQQLIDFWNRKRIYWIEAYRSYTKITHCYPNTRVCSRLKLLHKIEK